MLIRPFVQRSLPYQQQEARTAWGLSVWKFSSTEGWSCCLVTAALLAAVTHLVSRELSPTLIRKVMIGQSWHHSPERNGISLSRQHQWDDSRVGGQGFWFLCFVSLIQSQQIGWNIFLFSCCANFAGVSSEFFPINIFLESVRIIFPSI